MPNTDLILRRAHEELEFQFVRASGPGGQNVNKVATSAQLRFKVGASAALPDSAKARLRRLAGRRLTSDDILVIEARRYRTQEHNRSDAIARLDDLLRRSLEEPHPRVPTKATAASRQKRLESKRKKAETKRSRQNPSYDA